MRCQTATSIMQDYVEARLVQLDRSEFERHVGQCSSCADELEVYWQVFGYLDDMKPVRVPVGFQSAVAAQLRDQGLIHEPHVSVFKRWYERFNALPGPVRYPAAVGIAVTMLYFPLLAVLGLVRGFAGKTTVFLTDAFVFVQQALAEVSAVSRLFEVVGQDVQAVKTVVGALLSLTSAAGENFWLLSIGMVALLATVLIVSVVKLRKRSSHHALSAL